MRGGRGGRSESGWSKSSRSNRSDWLIGDRRSSRSSSFNCGRTGHRASECHTKIPMLKSKCTLDDRDNNTQTREGRENVKAIYIRVQHQLHMIKEQNAQVSDIHIENIGRTPDML
ncbi:unnamed protein product [Fraxinus pennsylvanica]|uniref:CCHC-type domain-containing protein n=1 Tax=Fraxinus pennsylvanica TaxID=56036 RepID=A0AAD1ZCH2_9LAMI|nr:unnamed protein product [Fraxinus pennsylvanica]